MAEPQTEGQSNRSDEQLQQEMQALKADLQKVQSDLQEIAQSVVGWGRQSYQQARSTASERVESSMDQLEHYVRERPLKTVFGALGIGVLAGMILRR